MPGFFEKNKKQIALLVLFLLLFWLVTIQVKAGRFTMLERPVLAVSGFFERIITGTYNAVIDLGRGYVFLVRAERENKRLKNELDRLRLENQITNELLSENERLRAALGFLKLNPPASVMVQVIGKEETS
jgi:cell shape-determining protein MreC